MCIVFEKKSENCLEEEAARVINIKIDIILEDTALSGGVLFHHGWFATYKSWSTATTSSSTTPTMFIQ